MLEDALRPILGFPFCEICTLEDARNHIEIPCCSYLSGNSCKDCNRLYPMGTFLEESGCDVSARNLEGATRLYVSSREGHVDIVEMLLDAGASPTACTNNERYPLHAAVMSGHAEVVRTIVKKYPKRDGGWSICADLLEVADKSGTTLWHQAAHSNQHQIVTFMRSEMCRADARSAHMLLLDASSSRA